jgi:hypothetical protein
MLELVIGIAGVVNGDLRTPHDSMTAKQSSSSTSNTQHPLLCDSAGRRASLR